MICVWDQPIQFSIYLLYNEFLYLIENGKSPERKQDGEPKNEEDSTKEQTKEENDDSTANVDKTDDEKPKSRSASPAKWVLP